MKSKVFISPYMNSILLFIGKFLKLLLLNKLSIKYILLKFNFNNFKARLLPIKPTPHVIIAFFPTIIFGIFL